MGWIVETERQWQMALQRSARIEAAATKIYEDLWEEILRDVTEAKGIERFAGLTVHNGRPLAHVVSFPEERSSQLIGPPQSVEITLHKSEHLIIASGVNLIFNIDLCRKAEAPCLKFEGEEVSYEAVSRLVLTPFLYPDFDPPTPTGARALMKGHEAGRKITG